MNNPTYIQVENIARSVDNARDRCILELFLETACKSKDLIKIKVQNINVTGITIGSENNMISKSLSGSLEKQSFGKKPTDFLFGGRQSGKITSRRLRQIVSKYTYEGLFVSLSPEDIRRISIYHRKFSRGGLVKIYNLNQLRGIRSNIRNVRDKILFDLLLFGFKSSKICNFKVENLSKYEFDPFLLREIKNYILLKGLFPGDFLFKTRQNSHLTKVRVFQIIKSLGHNLTPRILNDSGLFMELEKGTLGERLKVLGVKTSKFDFYGDMG